MLWKKHSSALIGSHAFLSASKYTWLKYSDEKLLEMYKNHNAQIRGTELHEIACKLIKTGIKLPDTESTLSMYVNDAIGFKMQPEQFLYFSEFCYGTADAISFRQNKLRIHDFKSGTTEAKFDQLLIYAACFCKEYEISPQDIYTELRIYQNNEVRIYIPEPEDIITVMEKAEHNTEVLRQIKALEE